VQAAIDSGKLDAKNPVDTDTMIKAGLFTRAKGGVKLLGGGEIKTKVDFSVWRASQSAIAAVEKAGGSVKILAPKKEEPGEPKGKNKRMALETAKGGGKAKAEKTAKSEATEDKTEERPKAEKAEKADAKRGKKPESKGAE
jgi:large subunit ribosomal protein L15